MIKEGDLVFIWNPKKGDNFLIKVQPGQVQGTHYGHIKHSELLEHDYGEGLYT
ncbi:MAG: tRNA (adenine-N1)-methyltransferase, partial [Synergistes sp.]|nr:tRNA (adenine-N1)-methyltransferase [Synergistes sp.]